MLDRFFTGAAALTRLREGPLGAHIDAFATVLWDRGYARSTAREHLRLIAALSLWSRRRRLGVDDIDDSRLEEFLRHRRKRGHARRGDRAAPRQLLEHLRRVGVVPVPSPTCDDRPVDRVARSFAQHLRQERGLAEATVVTYVPIARLFVSERFGDGRLRLHTLAPGDVTGFVRRYAHSGSPGRTRLMVTVLRTFCRWLRLRGEIATDLAACVLTVPDWRLATLPKSLPPDDVQRLLRACDRTTAIGRRDYALLLLLARLGLRAGEVVALTLDDMDWRAGELTVRTKGGRQDRLPLPRDVGAALVAYLRNGRPACQARHVFVRMRAPRRGFASSVAVCSIVQRALARAGLSPPRKGAHLLRHSLATDLLRRGASLREIGDVLRHRHTQTTEIYAKVDLTALHALALPWPGGA